MYSIRGKGIRIYMDQPFEVDGVVYASSWLRYATQEEKDSLGVVETPDPPEYDSQFYVEYGVPKDLEQVKGYWSARIKNNTNHTLQNTDWYIVRKYERDVDVPAEVEAYRAAVHAESARLEEAILAATTVEELKEVVTNQNWPSL